MKIFTSVYMKKIFVSASEDKMDITIGYKNMNTVLKTILSIYAHLSSIKNRITSLQKSRSNVPVITRKTVKLSNDKSL